MTTTPHEPDPQQPGTPGPGAQPPPPAGAPQPPPQSGPLGTPPGAQQPGTPGPGAQPPPEWGAPGWGPSAAESTSDERTWALLTHLSYFVIALIGPLIVMLTKGKESPFVRHHAVEALNFHLTLLIAVIVSALLIFVIIGIFTMIAALIVGVVYTIIAAIAASRGELYRYPLTIRMVK
ncbi:MAG: DUF4870 domain-containing protein [Actinomycetes bacterium]